MEFSIPQGSVQGAFLFIAYASTIQGVIKEDLSLNGFADDHSLRRWFNPNQTNSGNMSDEDSTLIIIGDSMQDIKSWMDAVNANSMNQNLNSYILEAIYKWQNVNTDQLTSHTRQ